MNTTLKTASLILLSSLLWGCVAAVPFRTEQAFSPSSTPVADQQERDHASYLARYMMSRNNRIAFESRLKNEHRERVSNTRASASLATGSQMVTDLAMGQLDSSAGAAVGTAVFVAGIGLDALDGVLSQMVDLDQVSQGYLPATVSGEAITSADAADDMLHTQVELRLKRFAEDRYFAISCLTGCDTNFRIYHLIAKGPQSYRNYHYNPETDVRLKHINNKDLYIVVESMPMQAAGADALRDEVLGFTPAWETPLGNTLVIRLFAGTVLNEQGEHKIVRNEQGKLSMPVVRNLIQTQMGRELYQTVFDKDFAGYYFDNDVRPHIGFFRGQAYTWSTENDQKFITHHLDMTPPAFPMEE